ncbi:MAG TPA: hypothetical protein VKU41_20295 [Polyangiaceae bacterium]|nr:hypothetical protein [Polyangiaceae bacterium]
MSQESHLFWDLDREGSHSSRVFPGTLWALSVRNAAVKRSGRLGSLSIAVVPSTIGSVSNMTASVSPTLRVPGRYGRGRRANGPPRFALDRGRHADDRLGLEHEGVRLADPAVPERYGRRRRANGTPRFALDGGRPVDDRLGLEYEGVRLADPAGP